MRGFRSLYELVNFVSFWFLQIRFFKFFSGRTIKMSSLSRELVFLILQFLEEEKFKETVHRYVILYFIYLLIFFVNFFRGYFCDLDLVRICGVNIFFFI